MYDRYYVLFTVSMILPLYVVLSLPLRVSDRAVSG